MRRGFSPKKSKVAEEMAARREQESLRENARRPTNPSIKHWKYFCHYNNAVYQGGMSAYKKHGKGLLLHDDGAAVVTEYLHDTPTGHNIIFRENSIASVLFKNTSEYEIAYKQGRYIIKIPFADGNDSAHGVGVLIDYQFNKIYELIFKRGALVEKILHLNRKNNEYAFKHNMIAKLMGLKHEQAFALTFEKPETMHIKQTGNELTIGYFDGDGEKHGLGFRSYGENLEVSGQKPLYLKSIQRGYYKLSQLETYGQKFFSNSNKYVGQFEKGQFHGHGILVCPQQMKWVYGIFSNGKLSQVIDSNNKKYTQNDFQMWTQGILDIHKRYRERWIDFRIELPDQLYLYNILKDSIRRQVTQVDPDLEEAAKEDEYRMGRIQQQFQAGFPGDIDRSYVEVELDKHYTVKRSSRVDTTPRRNRIDPHSNRQPIYIDDPHSSKQRPRTGQITTPISRVPNKKTPENSPVSNQDRGERHYRMQDPFQIELVKVPMNKNQRDTSDRFKQRLKDSIKEDYERPTPNITLPDNSPHRTIKQASSSFRYADNLPSSYQGIYKSAYYDELEKQREIYRRLERQDKDYIDNLRSGISRSPVHRDYYSTPSKFDPVSSRYGKIINKKNFDYQDPHESPSRKYQREAERDNYLREPSTTNSRDLPKFNGQPSPTYPRDPAQYKREPSPSNLLANSPYRGYKDSMGNSRTYIQNNYQHWR